VSRLFPDRLLIHLSPGEVAATRFSGPWGKQVIQESRLACTPAPAGDSWQGAIAALQELPRGGPCRVTVVLANPFVRYAVLPWSNALVTPAEEEAYVRHHLMKIHGEPARNWGVRSSRGSTGPSRLASAIDAGLLDALVKQFAELPGAKLVSVQPKLMESFNAWRALVPAQGAWLVLAEPERSCVALFTEARWSAVLSGKGPWIELLERALYLVPAGISTELPNLVLLNGAPAPEAGASRWTFQVAA
jgi:hypothetical protein